MAGGNGQGNAELALRAARKAQGDVKVIRENFAHELATLTMNFRLLREQVADHEERLRELERRG